MGTPRGQPLIYLQIARMLEGDILRGVYREGGAGPQHQRAGRAFRINPATAAKGINLLAASGVLYKRRGIGMFVAPGAGGGRQRPSGVPPSMTAMCSLWSGGPLPGSVGGGAAGHGPQGI